MARNSKVIMAKNINLDRNYNNIIDYTEQQMLTLVNTNKVAESNNCSFIREKGSIKTPFSYSQCLHSNYLAFQNPDYDNKWFFAWIDDVIYKSDGTAELTFTVDEWSTWGSIMNKNMCWVEREHVSDDTIGLHTIPEGLACNNYKNLNVTIDPLYLQDPYIVVMSTYDPENDRNMGGASIWNGVVTGAEAYIFRFNIQQNVRGVMDFERFLLFLNAKDKLDAVQNIYIVPYAVLGAEPPAQNLLAPHTATETFPTGQISTQYYKLNGMTFDPRTFTTRIQNLYSDLTYQPKNNKCLCYPYHYLFVTNNNGNANIYKGEFFSDKDNIEFSNQLVLCTGVSGRIAPLNYRNSSYNYDESIPLGKFPTCGWANDQYINWLTQNAINEPTKILNNLLGMQSSYNSASGKKATNTNIASGGVGVVTNVASIIGDFYSASLLPSTSAGGNVGDVGFSTYSLRFDFYNVILNDEELKIIDDYFTRFGYKVNDLKIPSFTSRTHWNYLKIADGEDIGSGEIPSKSMEIINQIFRTGTTIWHNHANIGNYNLNNSIVQ